MSRECPDASSVAKAGCCYKCGASVLLIDPLVSAMVMVEVEAEEGWRHDFGLWRKLPQHREHKCATKQQEMFGETDADSRH